MRGKNMIYTLTCNPALDYAVRTDKLCPGELHRPTGTIAYGGKGVNLSRALTALGIPNRALGFIAGVTGQILAQGVRNEGIDTDFIRLATGDTRINVKVLADRETELNALGPAIDEAAWRELYRKLEALRPGDMLCLCGSVPPPDGVKTYAKILDHLRGKGIRTAVDCGGSGLNKVIAFSPDVIKPNRAELEEAVGRPLPDRAACIEAMRECRQRGAKTILLSLGKDGAMLADGEEIYACAAPSGKVVSTIGSGDSMLAGFLAARENGLSAAQALCRGIACGSARAFTPGAFSAEVADRLYSGLQAQKL